jgi:dimethylamine monooxygenase subunit A
MAPSTGATVIFKPWRTPDGFRFRSPKVAGFGRGQRHGPCRLRRHERTRPLSAWPAVDSSGWGAPFDAFPVEAPFQVRPDLVKLLPGDDWLRVDCEWTPMLAAKLAVHASGEVRNFAVASPGDERASRARIAAITRAVDRLAASAAGRRLGIGRECGRLCFGAAGYQASILDTRVRLEAARDDSVAAVRTLQQEDPRDEGGALQLLGALALSVQEDLVLMEQGADGAVRAALLQVAFPSAWDPATKVGQDLFGLHAPVADNAQLQAAASRLATALISKGPFVRWVWTVTADPRWRAWPPLPPPAPVPAQDMAPPPLYFRLERQATMPLGEGYGLFLIRVQVRPLEEVLSQPGRLALLQASLRSMSDAMVRYKNLGAVGSRLLGG